MKTRILFICLILSVAAGLGAAPLIPVTLGAAFPNYETSYMLVGSGLHVPLQNNMEFTLTGAFGIRTDEDSDGNVDADFLIPINGGINFLFPSNDLLSFLGGVGLTAQMEYAEDDTFHMGPYVKGGVRYRVHKNMQLTMEVQQDLVFGPPKWINTTTQVRGGIVCNLD